MPELSGCLRAAGQLLQFLGREQAARSARRRGAVSPDRQADEADDDEQDGDVERWFRLLSVRHVQISSVASVRLFLVGS